MDDKETIRERLLERRRELSDDEQRVASGAVERRLQGWADARRADAVAGYLSFDNEVDVSGFLEWSLRRSRRVALPRVEDDESMEYVDVDGLDEVREGSFGIMEPVGSPCELEALEFFLVPGVGFDRRGRRIGMGWGYYDRVLTARRRAGGDRALFVGICYDWQLLDGPIPSEAHDVDMDVIVTDEERLVPDGSADS